MMDDAFDEDLRPILKSIFSPSLTDEEIDAMITGTRYHLAGFILDSNLPSPESLLGRYAISLSEEEMSVALEESEERTSRLGPMLRTIDNYATVVALAMAEYIFDQTDEVPTDVLDKIVDYLADLFHATAVSAIAGTLTQLERRGHIVYMWELEDL